MSKTARGEAIAHLHSVEKATTFTALAPDPSEYSGLKPASQTALQYWNSIRPRRYAGVARTMAAMFKTLFTEDTNYFREFLSQPPDISKAAVSYSPWALMALHTGQALREARTHIADSAAYHDSLGFVEAFNRLFPDETITLEDQFDNGGRIATSAMLTMLRNTPRLVKYHDPGFAEDSLAVTAKQSVGLPWCMAITSASRMLIMRHNTSKGDNSDWSSPRTLLDPSKYILLTHEDETASLQYVDGIGSAVILPTPASTTVEDSRTIGCPITLIGKYMHKMWGSYIETIADQKLWTPGGDPPFS